MNHLGFSKQEVLEKKVEELLTVGSKIFFQTHFYPLIKIQKKADEIFMSFLTKEKKDIPVLLNVALYEYDNGIFEIHCGGMQISRRNRFEKELLEDKKNAQKALEGNVELIAIRNKLLETQKELELQLRDASRKNIDQAELNKVLTHDLQEPLRKISIYISRLISYEESNLNNQTFETLKKITGFAEKVRSLLDNLERFNSLNNVTPETKEINLSEIIDKVKSWSATITKKIEFEFDNPSKSPLIFISDLTLITNLFKQLVESAVKFKNPDDIILKISIKADVVEENFFHKIKDRYQYKNFLRITFESNGIQELKSEANPFELFKRYSTTLDELGIGLTYCRRIVQLLNGTITVSSNTDTLTALTIMFPIGDS